MPRDLETIVLKAMARDPGHRYQTPTELAEDLKRFVEDRPIRARRASEAERLWRWCRRNPGSASLTAALLFSLLLGLAGVTWKWQEAVRNARSADLARLDAEKAQAEAEQTRNVSQKQTADLQFARGLALAERGAVGEGMHWLVESLKTAPEKVPELRRLVRLNLTAWASQIHPLRRTFHARGWVTTTAFSPDGKRLLTTTQQASNLLEGYAQLWDTASGQPLGPPLRHPHGVTSAAFRPNGQIVVTVCDRQYRLWETATGKLIRTFQGHPDASVVEAFSPAGQLLLTRSPDKTARLWDVATGQESGPRLEHTDYVWQAAFSPDGKKIVTVTRKGNPQGGEVQIWETAARKRIGRPLRFDKLVHAAFFTPDGKVLLIATLDAIRLRDLATDQWVGSPLSLRDPPCSVALSPDGQRVLWVSSSGRACLWDLATRKMIGAPLMHPALVLSSAFSPDGRWIVTGKELY